MIIGRDNGASVHEGSAGSELLGFRELTYTEDGALDTF